MSIAPLCCCTNILISVATGVPSQPCPHVHSPELSVALGCPRSACRYPQSNDSRHSLYHTALLRPRGRAYAHRGAPYDSDFWFSVDMADQTSRVSKAHSMLTVARFERELFFWFVSSRLRFPSADCSSLQRLASVLKYSCATAFITSRWNDFSGSDFQSAVSCPVLRRRYNVCMSTFQ